jgi:hypothetical protein
MWFKQKETPPPFVSSSDHDDWENEYYARKSCGGILGLIGLLGVIITILGALLIQLITAIV